MTSRRDVNIRVGANVNGALAALDRVQQRARGLQRTLNNVGGGVPASAIGGVGRAGRGISNTLAAGAGVGAGMAVVERIIDELFQLFEDTDVMEQFTTAMKTLLQAAAPIVGVLLSALTPALIALTPAIEATARALAPLVELLGGVLLAAVKLLTPALVLVARLLEWLTTAARNLVNSVLGVFGVNAGNIGFSGAAQQLTDKAARDAMDAAPATSGNEVIQVDARVIIDGQTVDSSVQNSWQRSRELGLR